MLAAFSLVIPAFNEADRIGDTVATVLNYLRSNSPTSEVIVVD
ncbi:MAG: glycosyltransferase, partial [Chthoniobacterales bacterium]